MWKHASIGGRYRCVRTEYSGDFTVEYEGAFDGTLRLYRSVERARTVVAALG